MQRFTNFIFRLQQLFPAPWPTIWVWIMLANIVLGLFAPNSLILTVIRLSGIFLCLVYTRQIFRKDVFLQLALLVTFCADIVLALNNTAEAGVAVFFVAQILHSLRLSDRKFHRQIFIFALVAAIATLISLFLPYPIMYTLCFFYVTALVTNILISWRWSVAAPHDLRSAFSLAGFLLFLCCDICIGVSYLAFSSALPVFFYAPANFFGWLFYYPSQVLISNSSKTRPFRLKSSV